MSVTSKPPRQQQPQRGGIRKALHVTWRVVKPVGEVVLAVLVVLAVVLIPAKTGSSPGVQQNLSDPTGRQVANYQAAGGAPLPGDASLIPQEEACLARTANPGFFKTMAPGEGVNAQRSNSAPCASWTGNYTNPSDNQVLAYQAPAPVGGTQNNMVTGAGPEYFYTYCCGSANQASYGINQGHAVAEINARTLQIVWKTPLDNWHASGQWDVGSGIDYVTGPSGKPALLIPYGHRIAKLDPATGKILANVNLPVGAGTNPLDVNYETIIPTPDGTAITKTQTRPATTEKSSSSAPCTTQGFTAMSSCKGKQPLSQVTAIDPDTMKILSSITLPQEVGGRNTIGVYNGRTYMYMTGNTKELRVIWNPATKKLTFDNSLQVSYLKKNQAPGSAPCMLGKWVMFNTNSGPAHVSPQIIAVSQGNPNNIHRITAIPYGNGPVSFWPSKLSCDPTTDTVYQADTGLGKIAAVHLDPATGNLKLLWRADQRTFSFFTTYGPSSQRVVLSTNINISNPQDVFGVGPGVYGEQFVWRQAATGKVLARSGYYDSMSQGILPTPGYGGLWYMLQTDGGIVSMEVVKKSSS
jgi:hypothetical protein